jgi:predicted GH43/DUF377 family glycosyl hydrolase
VPVEQSLLPGAANTGTFDGKKNAQPYSYDTAGIESPRRTYSDQRHLVLVTARVRTSWS